MGINFGSYDQSITFGNFSSTDDGYGGALIAWTPVLTTFARIMQVSGGNRVEALQLTLPRTYQMGIQWRSTFQPDESMQVLYRGAYHKINAVELMDERMTKEYIITMIRVGQADNPNFNEPT
jgi:SPP1 family predicted phage head-tail adaptor